MRNSGDCQKSQNVVLITRDNAAYTAWPIPRAGRPTFFILILLVYSTNIILVFEGNYIMPTSLNVLESN